MLQWVRLNYTTTQYRPPPITTTYNHPAPSTIIHKQPRYIHQHPPPSTATNKHPKPPTTSQNISTTTHHNPKNGPPPSKTQNIFTYNLILTLFSIFLFVAEILCDKGLISLFFKFKISTTFYDSLAIFKEFKVT